MFLLNLTICLDSKWSLLSVIVLPQGAPLYLFRSIVLQHKELHLAGRALTSDWSVNSFVMVIYENFFNLTLGRKFWLIFKKILIDTHNKTMCGSVRNECSSYRGYWQKLASSAFGIKLKFTVFLNPLGHWWILVYYSKHWLSVIDVFHSGSVFRFVFHFSVRVFRVGHRASIFLFETTIVKTHLHWTKAMRLPDEC